MNFIGSKVCLNEQRLSNNQSLYVRARIMTANGSIQIKTWSVQRTLEPLVAEVCPS